MGKVLTRATNSRRKFLAHSALGLAFAGTIVAGGSYLTRSKQDKLVDNSPFDMAKANEAVRQQYLDTIFADQQKYGVPGWDSFACLVYDPVFERMGAELRRRGVVKKDRVEGYSPGAGLVRWMSTPYFGEKGMKLATYVGKAAFEQLEREDDLLSALDHESFHAQVFHKGNIHFSMRQPKGGKMSQFIFDLMSEVCGFEKQFYYIETGYRKVSKSMLDRCIPMARMLYSKLENVALQETTEGEFARGLIEAIQSRPTARYFR